MDANDYRIPTLEIGIDQQIRGQIFVDMSRQARLIIGRLFPIQPALRGIALVIGQKEVQAPRIDVLPIESQDHGRRTNGTALSAHRRGLIRPQLVVSPFWVVLGKSLDRKYQFREKVEASG